MSLIDISNSLLLLSLSLALSSKLPIGILLEHFIYRFIASASNSDSESNELKMSIILPVIKWTSIARKQIYINVRNNRNKSEGNFTILALHSVIYMGLKYLIALG